MNEFLNYLERLALEVSRFIALLAGVVLLWIVLVTCVDVIGRYFFAASNRFINSFVGQRNIYPASKQACSVPHRLAVTHQN